MKFLTLRLTYFFAFLCVIMMFVLAFYLEYWKGVAPCPLCILQRVVVAVLGVLFFLGSVLNLKKMGQFILGGFGFILSVTGYLLAARQVWIQHLPPNQTPDCGVSLEYMLHVLPLDQVAKKIFEGTAECSLVNWTFLDLSLAQWSLIWFAIFGAFTLWQTFRST